MIEALPPMPSRYLLTQLAYAKMISDVQDLTIGTKLTPAMALMLAFVGDQVMTRTEIHRYGYFIGTNLTYSLEQLEKDRLIERLDGCVSADRRRRPVKLTEAGRGIALALRRNLAMAEPAKAQMTEAA